MPKATAVWLIENTALTFGQIADFTNLTELEVEALADEDINRGLQGRDPVKEGILQQAEIDRCQSDPNARLRYNRRDDLPPLRTRSKGPRYTPVSKRGDKPDAIAWLLKFHPEISDAQICKLIGTTKPTIASVRDRTHPATPNIKPRHPQELGLCTYQELDDASRKGYKAQGKDPDEIKAQKERELAEQQAAREEQERQEASENEFAGFDFSNFISRSGSSGSNQ
ncbi:MAG: DUF1013 domain-containing protein [Alphaproteobacteria bacterium]|nr:DUF1013 domain-containing protein [Alphaproteobacteria bacterium]